MGFQPCYERRLLDGDGFSFQGTSRTVTLFAQPLAKDAVYPTNSFDRLAFERFAGKFRHLLRISYMNHDAG